MRWVLSGGSMDKATIIIPHYHANRRVNLCKIKMAVSKSKHQADLLIFNNNKDYIIDGQINSFKNYGSSIRYAVAPFIQSDIFIFHDDDLVVGENTVGEIVKFLCEHKDAIVGFCGSKIVDIENPYKKRVHVNSNKTGVIEQVDIVLGRLTAMRRETLAIAISAMCKVPLDIAWTHEDIPISIANKGNNWVMPLDIQNIETGGVGLEHQSGHYDKRNNLARQCLGIFK
jgi:hypothetical protein